MKHMRAVTLTLVTPSLTVVFGAKYEFAWWVPGDLQVVVRLSHNQRVKTKQTRSDEQSFCYNAKVIEDRSSKLIFSHYNCPRSPA